MKKDWDGKTVREEGENVCVGTGASGLQDPPVPTAATSATFPASQGKRQPFKQVSSAQLSAHTRKAIAYCARGAPSQV